MTKVKESEKFKEVEFEATSVLGIRAGKQIEKIISFKLPFIYKFKYKLKTKNFLYI